MGSNPEGAASWPQPAPVPTGPYLAGVDIFREIHFPSSNPAEHIVSAVTCPWDHPHKVSSFCAWPWAGCPWLFCSERAENVHLHIPRAEGCTEQPCQRSPHGVRSQAGEQNTSERAPRKHLPPGSVPVFQAYLQAVAQRRTSIMCSLPGKQGTGEGGRLRDGLCQERRWEPGWGQPVVATPRGCPCRVPSPAPRCPLVASNRVQGLASDYEVL